MSAEILKLPGVELCSCGDIGRIPIAGGFACEGCARKRTAPVLTLPMPEMPAPPKLDVLLARLLASSTA